MKLRRYWFTFAREAGVSIGLGWGCGVTAFDLDDARRILKEKVFPGTELPIASCTEDIDVSSLDPGHVLPNMSPPNLRGIWFPLGFP